MEEGKKYKPKEFAELVGVTVKTLQNWDNNGTFIACRTPTNRRYYTEKHVELYEPKLKKGEKAGEQDEKLPESRQN